MPALLDAVGAADDLYFDAVNQVHMPTWSQGRATLVGDAGLCASPLSGMGTTLAMVGAATLAEALESSRRCSHSCWLPVAWSGVEVELASRSVPPSTLSLLGLVRHLADVERRWFRQVLAKEDAPARFSSDADPDGDFDGATPEVADEAWAAWRDEVAFADAFVETAPDLDITGEDGWRGTVSLRWVLVHMIEEYARHNGHADLLRERIDGAIGV